MDLFSAPYKLRLYDSDFLYKITQIFTWYKNSEVKLKSRRHTAHGTITTIDRSIDRCNCHIATVFCAIVSVSMLLLFWIFGCNC
jgi:hypothetical protein